MEAWIFEHLDKRCRWVHFLDKAGLRDLLTGLGFRV